MTPARPWTSVLVALVSSVLFWIGLDMWTGGGGTRPPISWAAPIGTLALVAVVVAAGWPVRRYLRSAIETRPVGTPPRKRLDPLVAARTAVLAKAAAYVGAVLVGWYVAQAAVLLPDLVGARRHDLVLALIAVVTAVLLVTAGFVVQAWCRVPPDDGPSGSPDEDLGDVGVDRPAR